MSQPDEPHIHSTDELKALYERLERLIADAHQLQASVSKALADNTRRDQDRVAPEARSGQRAHAHDNES